MGSGFGTKKYAVAPDLTRRLTVDEISTGAPQPPTLIVRFAGESNAQWFNSVLRHRPTRTAGVMTPGLIKQGRLEDAALFAECIVEDWEHVLEDGKPVACTRDAVLRFLTELIENCPDVWMRISAFCTNTRNFRESTLDPVDLGKA